ncbi:MBL fold metallo-hydrolase [Mycobacteroides abscessus]|uniref:MBL fold metallo-hydrolase n=1 Tax=Mycobacteroides abscessus TaxID=36809 RepID=UPI0013903344|nr:MBL fold metallo-hydrolase [Mycobacteroides abscessus]
MHAELRSLMKVHHLNCGTIAPFGGRLVAGTDMPWQRAELICHCLLIETADRLVLIDTGFGLKDVARPFKRLGAFTKLALMPRLETAQTAVRQIERRGFAPGDVTDILITHLDSDHVGGVDDLPAARVHVYGHEGEIARLPASFRERIRYRGRVELMQERGGLWTEHHPSQPQWRGFTRTKPLADIAEEIFFLSLPGHTRGHAGVVIDTGPQERARWLVHAGDAYMHHEEMDTTDPKCPPLTRSFQILVAEDNAERRRSALELRRLAARSDVRVINAHSRRYLEHALSHTEPTARDDRAERRSGEAPRY